MEQETMTVEEVMDLLTLAGREKQRENAMAKRKHKYGAVPTEVDGIRFASKKEAEHYGFLKALLDAGEITDLELQPEFDFVIDDREMFRYRADFRYWDVKASKEITVDVKGFKTPVYRLKKKLIEAQYGIVITEV